MEGYFHYIIRGIGLDQWKRKSVFWHLFNWPEFIMCSLESDQEANPNNQDRRAMRGRHIQTLELRHALTNGCTFYTWVKSRNLSSENCSLNPSKCSILPTIEWIFFCNFVSWLGTCTYDLNQDAQTCLKVKALLEMDQSVHYLLHTRISWHVCVICEEPASDITATVVWGGIPQVFPVECWSWHLLSRWILSWAGIHYLSLGWEWILTTPSLLECSLRRNHRI